MKKEHDIRIDRTKLHPWLNYKLTLLLKQCAKKGIYLIITEGFRSKEYQDKLQVQIDYWNKIKKEIEAVRSNGYENTDIVNMSETYFKMADDTVSAAENYSEKIATKIRTIELLSVLDMLDYCTDHNGNEDGKAK